MQRVAEPLTGDGGGDAVAGCHVDGSVSGGFVGDLCEVLGCSEAYPAVVDVLDQFGGPFENGQAELDPCNGSVQAFCNSRGRGVVVGEVVGKLRCLLDRGDVAAFGVLDQADLGLLCRRERSDLGFDRRPAELPAGSEPAAAGDQRETFAGDGERDRVQQTLVCNGSAEFSLGLGVEFQPTVVWIRCVDQVDRYELGGWIRAVWFRVR